MSEDGYRILSSKITCNQPRAQSGFLPFIVAAPDFLEEDNRTKCLVEIKSTQHNSKSSRLHLTKNAHLQLWIAMDVFNINKGKIICFKLSKDEKSVSLVSTVEVRRVVSAIEHTSEILILCYIKFLRQYFSVYLKPLTPEAEEYIYSYLMDHIKKYLKSPPKTLPRYPRFTECIPQRLNISMSKNNSEDEGNLVQRAKSKKSESEKNSQQSKYLAFLQAQFRNNILKDRLRIVPCETKNLYLKRSKTFSPKIAKETTKNYKLPDITPLEEKKFSITYDINQLTRILSKNVSIRIEKLES